MAQDGHRIGALDHRHTQVKLGRAHHGTAGENLIGMLRCTNRRQQIVEAGADGNHQVLGLHDDVAGDRHDPPDQGHTGVNRIVDRLAGSAVEHRAAHRRRQSPGGNLPSGNGLDQLFFRALGILGPEHIHLDPGGGADGAFQGVDGFRLIVLDADMGGVQAQNLHNDLQAGNQLRGIFPAEPVVSDYVRLTFADIDNNGIHLAQAGGKLHMGGEGGAAHAHDTGLPDDIHQFLGFQSVYLLLGSGLDLLGQNILMVVLDHYAHDGGAVGMGLHIHGLYLAGDGSMDRYAKALIVANLLAHLHIVPLLHQRLAGRADVLCHRHHQKIRLREIQHRQIACVYLVFLGMHPSEKRKHHYLHLFQKSRSISALFLLYNNAYISICPHAFVRFAQDLRINIFISIGFDRILRK